MDHINNSAHNTFMAMAIAAMQRTALEERSGEPFGAVVVRNNELIAVAGNSVGRDNDPTAHAEINAIRAACKVLNSWDLSGCILYTSCQCCPKSQLLLNLSNTKLQLHFQCSQ